MKTALLRRTKTSDAGTFGTLEIMGHTFATGELPDRGNEPMMSSIPAGVYECRWTFSPHFTRFTYEIMDVPDRIGVRIHIGNYCGDVAKGLKSDVDGCCLLGVDYKDDVNGQPGVVSSGTAIKQFEDLMGGEAFQIAVINEYEEAGASNGKGAVIG